MKYLLTVLSSGRPEYLARTLAAFDAFAAPAPAEVYVYDDGAQIGTPAVLEMLGSLAEGVPVAVGSAPRRRGMCESHGQCWDAASRSDFDWTFHLEDDYVLLRPIRIDALAELLEYNVDIEQMALVRTPWGAEIPYGGYIPQEPAWYERTTSRIGHHEVPWIAQTRNWTAAPCLFSSVLAHDVMWPEEAGCETAIGPLIREHVPGARFGLWGWGEPWCAHIGIDRAPGSHGY